MVYKRRATKRKASKPKKTAKLSKPMRRAIKQVVQGESETKRATFYQTANDGTGTEIATGLYANRGWAVQNNTITNNTVDILQLIPYIAQGTDDWERIGDRVRPVKLGIKGSVRVAQQLRATVATPTTNLHVCMYVLQHVSLKDYTNLRAQNNFGQLLETGEGTTVFFNGEALNPHMRVHSSYYKVCAKKVLKLKYAGIQNGPNTQLSIANAHSWYADYSMDLTKHIPKLFKYPEDAPGANPLVANVPTNSSIFLCMGYVNEDINDAPPVPDPFPVTTQMQQIYVSELLYKDM